MALKAAVKSHQRCFLSSAEVHHYLSAMHSKGRITIDPNRIPIQVLSYILDCWKSHDAAGLRTLRDLNIIVWTFVWKSAQNGSMFIPLKSPLHLMKYESDLDRGLQEGIVRPEEVLKQSHLSGLCFARVGTTCRNISLRRGWRHCK